MPLIKYQCTKCNFINIKFQRPPNIPEEMPCPQCDSIAVRALGIASSKSIISIDNGLQSKQVELDSRFDDFNTERRLRGSKSDLD